MVNAFRTPTFRRLHRASALLLGAFVVLHLGNHLAGLAGQEAHGRVQALLRPVYRGWAEPVLLAACAVQVASGLRLAWGRRAARGRARLQVAAGLYLALFLAIHVGAVLTARALGQETDLAFAAAGLHRGAWALFFAPYYFLAVAALALHLSVPLHRRSAAAARAVQLAGVALAVVLVALLAGWIVPLRLPV